MHPTLDEYLDARTGHSRELQAVAWTLRTLAAAAQGVAELVARGTLSGNLARVRTEHAVGGDAQKELDALCHRRFLDALRTAPVASLLSEEADLPLLLNDTAPLAVAIDPLDGSSNIDANLAMGTIFSILPARESEDALASFLQPGSAQIAAGFFVYGPQTSLAFTMGAGTCLFVLDRDSGHFRLAARNVAIPSRTREYAINAANRRHWDAALRAYVDDLERGDTGPRRENFKQRWTASVVAEAWRILARGGVYLYPRDDRVGYRRGRLHLIYEANPIALLVEQAGGAATDGERRIMDLRPEAPHERTGLVFGATAEVGRVARYCTGLGHDAERSPLFQPRGLLRA